MSAAQPDALLLPLSQLFPFDGPGSQRSDAQAAGSQAVQLVRRVRCRVKTTDRQCSHGRHHLLQWLGPFFAQGSTVPPALDLSALVARFVPSSWPKHFHSLAPAEQRRLTVATHTRVWRLRKTWNAPCGVTLVCHCHVRELSNTPVSASCLRACSEMVQDSDPVVF